MLSQTEFILRPYNLADAPQVVEFINASAALTVGVNQAVVDSVGNVRLARYTPSISEKVVVTNAQNDIVGFAYYVNAEQYIVSQVGGAVHPDYWGRGIGLMLVTWAERQASVLTQYAPPGLRTVLQTNLYADESEAIRLFTECGFIKVREWAHLVIELDGLLSPPPLPGDLIIRAMDLDNDWDIVGPAMEEAFADHWGTISVPFIEAEAEAEAQPIDEPEDESYSNAPGFCFIVLAKHTVVGGILCNAKLVERFDTGRIGSLFVGPMYRGQGVGRALMVAAFNAFWENGIKRIITDTDAESFTDAPKFYTSLGMRLYRREYLYEKEIRPGTEVRRLER
jgi:mycothiol synthase